MIKVVRAEPAGEFKLKLSFSTGESGVYDFADLIARPGAMVAPLRAETYFARYFIELGALAWPNGFDLSPKALYETLRNAGKLAREHAA